MNQRRRAAIVVLLTFWLAGCAKCAFGEDAYPDWPDLSPETASAFAVSETSAYGPAIDDQLGWGRVAQYGRRMKVHVEQLLSGAWAARGDVTFLYPALDVTRWGGGGIQYNGAVPDLFMGTISGMRVGGIREFTIPPGCVASPSRPWNCSLVDSETRQTIFEFANQSRLRMRVTVMAVCKPEFCVYKTFSIPKSEGPPLLHEGSCR